MRTLAKFHGASVILYKKEPQCFQPYLDTLFAEEPVIKLQKSFVEGMTKLLIDEIRNWPGFGEKYSKKLQQLAPRMQQLVIDGARRQEGRFNVLTHDDLWINNMMFNSEGSVRFIDFQMPHYASLGNDVLLFYSSSLTDEVRRKHFQTLLKEYHKVLCETLTRLGYEENLITLEELHEECWKSSLYGFALNVIFLPGVFARADCEIPMFEVNGPAPKPDIYEGSRARTVMAEILKEFEKHGVFTID
ncbi:hypothetical protein C0J52_09359 [Blattella germanica]|nr:hypothetical protein C0J52_09359 [Blattella germanica]